MSVETYRWPCQPAGAASFDKTVRTAKFADGYEQVAEQGINSTMIEAPLMHTGPIVEIDAVHDFLERHMVKAFAMTPPGGVLGLYRVVANSLRRETLGRNVAVLTFTVRRAYGVYA